MDERKERSGETLSVSGCIVEWRLKPESTALKDVMSFDDARPNWRQAPYTIDALGRDNVSHQVVQPFISPHDDILARYDLVTELVAEAIIACLKTAVQPRLLAHVEWRIAHVRLEASHKIFEEDSDGQSDGKPVTETPPPVGK